MPPRNKDRLDSDDENAGSDECSRLKQLAQDQKICSKQRKLCSQDADLPRYLSSADGKDILKKSFTRKGRCLFHIAAEFNAVVGGRMGTLAQLDSKNPVLLIDFPLGRLKMIGTLLFPKAKYLLLKFGTKDVLCEDIFDSVVLFAEMHWVGTKEDNPSEAPLDMPEELQTAIVREPAPGEAAKAAADGVTLARRRQSPGSQPASQLASQPASQPATQRSRGGSQPRSAQKRRKPIVLDDDSSDDQGSGEGEGAELLSQRQHLGRSSKAAAQKKLLEFSEEEDDADSTDGDGGSNGGPAAVDAGGADDEADARSVDSGPDSSPEPPVRGSQAAPAKKAAGKRPAPSKAAKSQQKRQKRQPASGRKASRKVVDSSGESSGEEEEEDEDDDDSNFTG